MQFLLILFLITTLYSKDFSVIIHQPFDAELFDVTEDYDRTISAIGVSKKFKAQTNTQETFTNAFDFLESNSQQYGSQMHLIKVDEDANVLLSKTAKLTKFNTAVSLKKTPTNGYFVGGYTMDGSLLVAKLNTHAKVIRSVLFGTKNFDRMRKILLLSDGGILAIGSSTTSRDTNDAMFETGLGNNDIFITRFDPQLHMLWSKKYGTCHDDVGIDAAEAFDGTLIILSTTSYEGHRNVSLMRLSENGDRIWLKHFQNPTFVIPTRIITLRDTNFLISLIEYDKKRKEHIRLIKFDLYNNILADVTTKLKNPSALYDIAEFSNGEIMGVGYTKKGGNTDALAILFDADLHKKRSHHYGTKNYDIFHALTILHNSKVAAVGIHTDTTSQEANMWLVTLNKDTTLTSITPQKKYTYTNKTPHNFYKKNISIDKSSFYQELHKLFQQEITNKQLTLSQDLTLTLNSPSLLFQAGQYQLSQKQKQFLQSFFRKLIPFLKQHKNEIEALQVNGHTSTEWKNTSSKKGYLKNMKLSQNRALSVIEYLVTTQNTKELRWLSKLLEGDGKSYKEQIVQNHKEDKTHSRRVSFKLIVP